MSCKKEQSTTKFNPEFSSTERADLILLGLNPEKLTKENPADHPEMVPISFISRAEMKDYFKSVFTANYYKYRRLTLMDSAVSNPAAFVVPKEPRLELFRKW